MEQHHAHGLPGFQQLQAARGGLSAFLIGKLAPDHLGKEGTLQVMPLLHVVFLDGVIGGADLVKRMTERLQGLCIAHAVQGRAALLRQGTDKEAVPVRKRIADGDAEQQRKHPDRADNPADAVQAGIGSVGTAGNDNGQSSLPGGAVGYQHVPPADLVLGEILVVSGGGQQLVNRLAAP